MKSIRNIAVALGVSLAAGAAFAGSALAEDGREKRQWRDDDNDHQGHDHDGGVCEHDGDKGRRDQNNDDDGGRWDRNNDDGGRWERPRWGNMVSVRFVNERDRMVTLYLNGQYLGRIPPYSRERISLPEGYHTVTYQVGWRGRGNYQQIGVNAFHGQRNRVVIEGRRGGWGRNWGY